jgi:uncharacterized protein YbaA (DUF1428 family)
MYCNSNYTFLLPYIFLNYTFSILFSMSKSDATEMEQEKEIGSIVQQFICLLPKKNHDAMLQIAKQANYITRKHGALRVEYFQLSSTEDMMDWTNISKTISGNQEEEEIWVEQVFYRDSKHRDEYMAKCGNDENMNQLYKQFMDLITPGSAIMGEFSRLEV